MSSGPPRPQWPQEEPAVDDAAPSANEYPGGRAKLGGTRLQFRPTNLAVHSVERRGRAPSLPSVAATEQHGQTGAAALHSCWAAAPALREDRTEARGWFEAS